MWRLVCFSINVSSSENQRDNSCSITNSDLMLHELRKLETSKLKSNPNMCVNVTFVASYSVWIFPIKKRNYISFFRWSLFSLFYKLFLPLLCWIFLKLTFKIIYNWLFSQNNWLILVIHCFGVFGFLWNITLVPYCELVHTWLQSLFAFKIKIGIQFCASFLQIKVICNFL